jgi:hypothetical protein
MTPTAKLRFVEREQATGQMITHRKILQQWWEHTEWNAQGEWRDIPTETEDFTQNKTSG